MAQLEMIGMDELFNEMLKMGEDTGQVASDMLEAATPILEKALEQSANRHGFAAPGKTGRGTGDMIASIDNFGVEMTRDGKLKTVVRTMSKDRHGNYNSEVAFAQNYGRSNMPATHWIDQAIAECENSVLEAMTEVWEKFLEGRQ